MQNKVIITDSSLRDGNHSVKHTISLESIKKYCAFAEKSNIPIVEVGHGNGLGASSILIGRATHTDLEILKTARENLKNTKLGVHIIPGLATIEKDIKPAIEIGVDVFRVATHCTEATVSKTHIDFLRKQNKNPALVIDINDCISVFNNWNRKRLSFYKSKNFKVESPEQIDEIEEKIDNFCIRE